MKTRSMPKGESLDSHESLSPPLLPLSLTDTYKPECPYFNLTFYHIFNYVQPCTVAQILKFLAPPPLRLHENLFHILRDTV